MGKISLRAPRRALLRIPPCKRARGTKRGPRHDSFQAEQESLSLNVKGIIESLFIQNQGVGESTNFQQMVPIAGVARESGDFQP